MIIKNNIRWVPRRLFERYAFTPTPIEYEVFDDSAGRHAISAVPLNHERADGQTVALYRFRGHCGEYVSESLFVYDYPVTPREIFETPDLQYLLVVRFHVLPPRPDSRWERGKGYWVDDDLECGLGGGQHSTGRVAIATPNISRAWLFSFLVDILNEADVMQRRTLTRGRWQVDISRTSPYLLKPKVFS